MDLTRLYNLTTPELRQEAERLGVTDTYAMSRGQLIQAIRAKAGEPEPDGFLGKVFGFAKWALKAAGETKSGTVAAPESEIETAAAAAAATAAVPASASESVSAASRKEDASHPPRDFGGDRPVATESLYGVPVPVLTPAPPLPAPEEAEAEVVSEPESDSEAESPTEADNGPPSRPPAGVFSPSPGLFEEPFPTLTMARILAEQGHYKRALAIYARLLDEEPADAQLGAEAEAVRAQARTRRSHAPN